MLSTLLLHFCILAFPTLSVQQILPSSDYYVGAVVNYMSTWNAKSTQSSNIMSNAAAYAVFMRMASLQMADIIVFPEMGLRPNNLPFPILIPDPKDSINPCLQHSNWAPVLTFLSCAARESDLYAVMNFDEQINNSSVSSTHVAFDKNGTIVARYRVGSGEWSYFDTDMGKRMVLLSDMDLLLYRYPQELLQGENRTHFVVPAAITNKLPFVTGIQLQWSWSWLNDSVLLAAGLVSRGTSGSGIYSGRDCGLYTSSERKESTFLLQGISTDESNGSAIQIPFYWDRPLTQTGEESRLKRDVRITQEGHSTIRNIRSDCCGRGSWRETLIGYNTELVKITGDSYRSKRMFHKNMLFASTLCQNDTCCNFSINVSASYVRANDYRWVDEGRKDDFSKGEYRAVAFSGVQDMGGVIARVRRCAIVPCLNASLSSCNIRQDEVCFRTPEPIQDPKYGSLIKVKTVFHSLSITSNFMGGPNILLTGKGHDFGGLLDSSSFIFTSSDNASTLSIIEPINKLISFGVQNLTRSTEKPLYSHAKTWSTLI